MGGTAEQEVDAIDKGCFERNRGMLKRWLAVCKEMHPNYMPEHIPDPRNLDWHRLAGDGGVLGDACKDAWRCRA